MNKDLYKPVGH